MMLMMLASLLSYSQYPTTKVINGETVVIMTVQQGENINNKFVGLKKDIDSLNTTLTNTKRDLNFSDRQLKILQNELKYINDTIRSKNELIKYYEGQMVRLEKLEYTDKKVRKRVTFGIIGSVIIWIGMAITIIKS